MYLRTRPQSISYDVPVLEQQARTLFTLMFVDVGFQELLYLIINIPGNRVHNGEVSARSYMYRYIP